MNKFLWLVRRELWEARSVWVAPAICAAIIIGAALVAAFGTGTITVQGLGPEDLGKLQTTMTPEHVDGIVSLTLGGITLPFFILVLFTQFFYAIDSLYGERRDRAILFWKSLPVSDAETVLSKLLVAAVIMPLVAAAMALGTQIVVFMIGGAKLAALEFLHGHLWSPALWAGSLLVIAYVLVASALWFLPLLGWTLLVSAWAPRSPLMYASLPPLGVGLAEYIVFHSHHALSVIGERVGNLALFAHAFSGRSKATGFGFAIDQDHMNIPRSLVETMRPGQFFGSPEVWLGVVVGAAFVAAAIWVRRSRDEAA
jgi:ABC-2 type transport system permease protein